MVQVLSISNWNLRSENRAETIFEEVIFGNSPELMKDINYRFTKPGNPKQDKKKSTVKHIIVKLQKDLKNFLKKMLEAARGEKRLPTKEC